MMQCTDGSNGFSNVGRVINISNGVRNVVVVVSGVGFVRQVRLHNYC